MSRPPISDHASFFQAFPHVNECQLCKVCIPHGVVASHPKAQAKRKEMAYMLDRGDLLMDPPAGG